MSIPARSVPLGLVHHYILLLPLQGPFLASRTSAGLHIVTIITRFPSTSSEPPLGIRVQPYLSLARAVSMLIVNRTILGHFELRLGHTSHPLSLLLSVPFGPAVR